MVFPDSFVDEVRRAADIVRVVSEHVTLKRAGSSWKGLCPFHKEKTPSFNVRSEPPLFHCFGCGEGGDVFKFLMLYERMSFPEAATSLARRFGVPVPEQHVEAGPERKLREEIMALSEAAARHFEQNLWTARGRGAREYLLGRGFERKTLERIRAGAAPDSWDDLLGSLRKHFSPASMVKAGLVLERQDRSGHYDRFRNRAVFPISNESGKVVAFGARSLDGTEPKYLNSPETAIYQKGRTLYGLAWAKADIRRTGRIVLMEGYLDVARALEAGVGEAVATCGTALTASHARLLRRFSERAFVNFDQDEAGQRAARRSLEVLLDEGLEVRVIELPPGEDPDSYLKSSGATGYAERIDRAPVYMQWLIQKAAAEHDTATPAGKAAYLEALLPSLKRLPSAVERAAWLPHVAERGGLDETATREEVQRAVSRRPAVAAARPLSARVGRPELRPAERLLLALILKGADDVTEALAELEDGDVEGLRSANVLRAARALYLRAEGISTTSLTSEVASDEDRRLITELAVAAEPTERVTALDCVKEIKCWPLKTRLAEIQKQLSRASEPEIDDLLNEKLQLTQQVACLTRAAAESR